ncbi:MAG: acyl-CoA dehydrogenase family protein [Dehalococcoidales bacterium]|nr:acyl-CoA dehydrogenase family protein [Dehalococcoidales bacterium]
MDFNLTEGQKAIQRLARDFSDQEIEPYAGKLDRDGILPDDLIKKMAKLDFLGMTVPHQYGGTETGNLDCILVIEQLAYSGTGAWWLVGFNNSIPESIVKYGSEEIKAKYLKPFCDGTAYASIQFTEAETGSDASALTTTARPDGDSYIINGMKRFSTFGARPGYSVTYTMDDEGKCTAFVTEKLAEGYSAPKIWELMGSGGMEAADVYYDDYRIPAANMLGKKGKGYDILLYWISTEKIEQCAAAVGIARAAIDEAVDYVKARLNRGKPVASMQGIRWQLAEMKAKLDACRLLTYKTAFAEDMEEPDWQTQAAAAKLFIVPAAMEIVEVARRLHGAYGYTREAKIERLTRAITGFPSIAVSLEINRSILGSSMVR